MSIDQRYKRASILDQRLGGGRAVGQRTPTYRGEMLHYSKKYGTSMDDQQLAQMDKEQKAFKQSISKARSQVDKYSSDVASQYSSGKAKIEAQRYEEPTFQGKTWDQAIAEGKKSGDLVPVHVFDEQNKLGVHYLDKDSAKNYVNSLEEAGHDYTGSAHGGGYWVNVKGYGKELHHPIIEAEQKAKRQYQEKYNAYKSQFDEQVGAAQSAFYEEKKGALSILDTQYGVAQEKAASQQAQIDKAIKANKQALNKIRNKYAQKMGSVKDTISAMFDKGKK
jgi:phosphoenolpyruvate-protein kinase (PTS system EI component)